MRMKLEDRGMKGARRCAAAVLGMCVLFVMRVEPAGTSTMSPDHLELALVTDLLAAGVPRASTESVLQVFRHYCRMRCGESCANAADSCTGQRSCRDSERSARTDPETRMHTVTHTHTDMRTGTQAEKYAWLQREKELREGEGEKESSMQRHDGGAAEEREGEVVTSNMNGEKSGSSTERAVECGVGVFALEKASGGKKTPLTCITSVEEVVDVVKGGESRKQVCIKLERAGLAGGGGGDLALLVEIIPRLKALVSVGVRHNALGDRGVEQLLGALQRARVETWVHSQVQLRELDLGHTSLTAAAIPGRNSPLATCPALPGVFLQDIGVFGRLHWT
jgi:hypothetical protein